MHVADQERPEEVLSHVRTERQDLQEQSIQGVCSFMTLLENTSTWPKA